MNLADLLLRLSPLRIVLALTLTVAAVHLAYGVLWDHAPVRGGDTASYLSVAQRMKAGEFLQPSFRTQGYPLLLWLLGLPPSKNIFWVGLALHTLSTLLLVWLMKTLGMSPLFQISLAAIMCLPLYVQSAGILMTENLAEFSLIVTFLLWFQSFRTGSVLIGASAGIAAAWSALVRPSYQLLPVALTLTTLIFLALFIPSNLRFRQVLTPMSHLAGMILLLSIMVMNQARFGYFALTPALGVHLCNRTALFVERADTKWEPLRSALIEARNKALIRGKSHTALEYQWDGWRELKKVTGLDDIQLAQRLMKLNTSLIIQNPLEYLAAVARSVSISFFPYVTSLAGNTGGLQVLWTAVHFALIGLWISQLWLVGGFSLFVMTLRRNTFDSWQEIFGTAPEAFQERFFTYWAAFSLIVYTLLINSLADIGDPRQRSPIDCFMLLQTLIGLEILLSVLRHWRMRGGCRNAA